jgi:hypothetical protein
VPHYLQLTFEHLGTPGSVSVIVSTTGDPEEVGAGPYARGLANCEARITYPGHGNRGRLGWVQLVRSTDNRSGGKDFEMDPLEILGDVPHPFCHFGIAPTLFDAPGRADRADLDWDCRSFLCRIVGDDRREVEMMTGFSWGFVIKDGLVSVASPRPETRWDDHLALLRQEYPDWRFAPSDA